MRTWISFPTGIRGIRLGAAVPLNTRPRIYAVSPIGLKVWRVGSAVILLGLVIWLIASRDQEGRLNENFLLVIIMVLTLRWSFGQVVIWSMSPHAQGLEQSTEREAPRAG
jgi:hypothetical protein